MTLFTFTGLFTAFPPMFQYVFLFCSQKLFSKILSPKYHTRESKEIRSRRTYKSLINIQTSHVNKGMNSVSQGHKMHSFCRITREGINPYGKFCRRITFELCFDRKEKREKQ